MIEFGIEIADDVSSDALYQIEQDIRTVLFEDWGLALVAIHLNSKDG